MARRVDEIVAETLLAWLIPEAVQRAQQRYAIEDDQRAVALQESLARAQQRRDVLMAELMGADPLTENWRQLDELRRATAQELDDLGERLAQVAAPSPLAALDASDLAERWDSIELDRQREALRIAVSAVWLRPAGERGEDPGARITTIDWRLDLGSSGVGSQATASSGGATEDG